jgi:type I restriction enzyme M protein
MLDNGTKKRIDSARDILVGKVPDPKSQVEQITIALIYKFMDDMDNQTEALGGKATFFAGEFKQFAWSRLLDRKFSGHERLLLYAEGIEKMNMNDNIPQLFRDIFKGAFLPYRDPETLNLFLKEINGFSYDHSEQLGNAFEYLLSVLSSQGDAGQFRTPRHIIDFIVEIVNPSKEDTVLDPACGTAGFLISSYKHILRQNTKDRYGDLLTADDKGRLMTNFCGYDISPDMVRLSLVNMYLHSFARPSIYEYDTLTSEDRWDERYDVIMANPPFMSPKGGIRPHSRFTIKAKRSEVLFVDYIAEHLNVHGRAGVIVPEGIIFQSQNAYKNLRKMLVDDGYLYAVISLPAGVFQPYSGVKTSILLMDKTLTKKTGEILFVKVTNDGFDLGAQRRPIDKNDLPRTLKIVKAWKQAIVEGKNFELDEVDKVIAHIVSKEKIAESGDYNFSGERYREVISYANLKWPMVELGDKSLFQIESGGTPSSNKSEYWDGDIRWITLVDLPQENFITYISDTKRKITELGLNNSSAKILPNKTVLVSSRATIGRIAISQTELATNQGFKNVIIKDFSRVNEKYLACMLMRLVPQMEQMGTGGTYKEISRASFSTLRIPLPPLEVQENIVAELDGYQKIIDGAKQIVENYKPTIKIDPDWPVVELGDKNLFQIESGSTPSSNKPEYWNGYIKWITLADLPQENFITYISDTKRKITELGLNNSSAKLLPNKTVLVSSRATIGRIAISKTELATNQGFKNVIIRDFGRVNEKYLAFIFTRLVPQMVQMATGGTYKEISRASFSTLRIPLPPLEIQEKIVAEIESERELVEGNKRLIGVFEKKMKDKIGEIWGE